jgi:predicted Rossmann fold flavoprotein
VEEDTAVIIGGGPAGLFCALQAAGRRHKVILLEKKRACGRKLLITGSGQCNLTHNGEINNFLSHYGDHGAFLRPALRNFTNRDLIAFFQDRGLPMEAEPGGKVFPATRRSADVLALLLAECNERGVDIRCGEPVRHVARDEDGRFTVVSEATTYYPDHLVIATGGASYPATGSSGDGYGFAREFGHSITEIAPALASVCIRDYPFADLAGISFEDLTISQVRKEKRLLQHTGDLLLTHTGLSGPGILDLSRYIAQGDVLSVSFIPGMGREGVRERVTDAVTANNVRLVKTVLSDLSLPDRFLKRLLDLSGIPPDLTCAHLSKKARTGLITHLTEFPFTVDRLAGFDEAMVTRGGVELDEINPKTLESRLVPHLYCIGEVLDIDGDTGGYNLQAAFSTAALAARHIFSA